MNKFIELAQERLRSKLSDKKTFYQLDDLRGAGLPDIILTPLQNELIHQLHRDLEMPLTEWANLNHKSVEDAWNAFMEEAERHIRLPEYKVNALLKSVVNRIYPLLVWPRTQIPKFIFRKNKELERGDIARRVEKLPVNQQLGSAVMRYMNKKNVDRLSREKCKDVIEKIDEKLTERYDDHKWYNSIRPIFEVAAGPVPTDLLASYFFHRGQKGWSNRLAQMAGKISVSEFEEWIKDQAPESESPGRDQQPTPGTADRKTKTDSESTRRRQPAAASQRTATHREKESNVNAQFAAEAASQNSTDSAGRSHDQLTDSDRQSPKQQQGRVDHTKQKAAPEEALEEDEPIWRRFLSASDSESDETDNERSGAEGVSESPSTAVKTGSGYQLNELFKEDNGELENESARALNRYLKGQREYFIREIFRGSLSAYEQAVRTLSSCEDWEEAYPYIDRQIFDRNDIDLYSQPALDFTDAMQSFFDNH